MSDPNNSVCSSSDATGTTTAAAWQILWDAATTLPATTIGCGVKLVGLGLLAGWLIHTLVSVWSVVHYNLQLLYEYVFIAIPDLQIELPPNLYATDVPTPTPSAPSPPVLLDDPAHPGMIQCYDPATLQHLGQVPVCSTADIRQMCAAAAVAQQNWKQTTFCQRRTVLRTLQQYICRHVESIGAATARDSGKAVVDAALGEVLTTTEKIRTICAHGEQWLQPSDNSRPTGPLLLHKTARVEYVPLGVIATIAPWNYPFHNYMNHIISGIFAGNAVVGKVSEHTSWSTVVYFSAIVRAALAVHGHDPNLVQTVTGYGDAGSALLSDPLVDKIIFTGSPAIGRKVMATAAQFLKPVILELGGKDAMVITEDCKLSEVIPWVLRGCFQNSGQNCVGVERVVVYESIHDEFVDTIFPRVKAIRQGIPLNSSAEIDCGALVMESQIQHIQSLVDDAVAKGAKLWTGGKCNSALRPGQFYEPTLLTGVTPAMRIFHEEVFGPVMTVIKVPKDDDRQCIELVNNSDFGLSASVYCRNRSRGLALGRQIRSGMCCVNDFGSNYLVQSLPFGGVKDSGFGRFAGIEGLRALCLERSILTDRIPGVKTSIPNPVDYPIDNNKGIAFTNSLIQLFYNESWIAKLLGIVGLIKNG